MLKMLTKFSVLISLFLVAIYAPTAQASVVTPQGSYPYNCSEVNQPCVAIQLSSFGTATAYSDWIYLPAGKTVYIDAEAWDESLFNISYQLLSSNNRQIGPTATALSKGGKDYEFFTVKSADAGNYRLRATCHDSSTSERCKGEGMVYYDN